jgi:hypothetical protein
MRYGQRAGVTFLTGFFILAGLSPAVQAAENKRVTLDYAVYVGGWETIKVSFDTSLRPETYHMKTALDGEGVLNWWFNWRMSAFSEGRLADGKAIPTRAGADSHWNGKHRQTRITYPTSGLPVVRVTPPPSDDDRDPVPEALRAGTRDLSGAVLTLLSSIGRKNGCDVREPVFDGRRRYDLVMTQLETVQMTASDYSPFSGAAFKCRLKVDPIAGYKRNRENRRKWRKSDHTTIWIGQVFDAVPPLPVRMHLDTVVGALIVHLVKAKIHAGGEMRQLTALP